MSNRRSISALFVFMFVMVSNSFIDPILSVRLIEMGMPESTTGLAFGVVGFAFMVGAPIAGWLSSSIKVSIILQVGLIVDAFTCLLVGPTLFFGGLPIKIWIMMIGLFFLGFCGSLMFVPIVPEVISAAGEDLKSKIRQNYI